MLFPYPRDSVEGAFLHRRTLHQLFPCYSPDYFVFPQDIAFGNGVGHGLNAGRVHLVELVKIADDFAQLLGKLSALVLRQAEPGEFCNVFDVLDGDH
jgi:hypothetical protein